MSRYRQIGKTSDSGGRSVARIDFFRFSGRAKALNFVKIHKNAHIFKDFGLILPFSGRAKGTGRAGKYAPVNQFYPVF